MKFLPAVFMGGLLGGGCSHVPSSRLICRLSLANFWIKIVDGITRKNLSRKKSVKNQIVNKFSLNYTDFIWWTCFLWRDKLVCPFALYGCGHLRCPYKAYLLFQANLFKIVSTLLRYRGILDHTTHFCNVLLYNSKKT